MKNNLENIEINMKKSLKDIYSEIFCRIKEQYIIVFLCGGASTKSKRSLRDKIRLLLENEKKGILGNYLLKYFIRKIY